MRSQEFTGKTTQDAIDAGLAALGVTIADVHVDVIQEGAKGLFGLFGSKPACVRLTVMEEDKEDDGGLDDLIGSFTLNEPRKKPAPKAEKKPELKAEPKVELKSEPKAEPKAERKSEPKSEPKAEPKAEKKSEPKPEKSAKPAIRPEAEQAAQPETEAKPERKPQQPKPPREKKSRQPKAESRAEAPREYPPMTPAKPFTPTEPPVIHPEDTPAGKAQHFLMDVTRLMNVKVDVYVEDKGDEGLYIHMLGDTLGILIGRRGETLDALQYLTSLQVNKGREGYIRVTLDTENYRAKREDSLRRLAQRMANRALKTGRKVVLEPMNPYERRVLHTALQNHPSVTTHSEGEEPNRRVVIMPANLPERTAQAEGGEERKDKPSSSRRRSRRGRGHRPKPAAQETAGAAEVTEAQNAAQPAAQTEAPSGEQEA